VGGAEEGNLVVSPAASLQPAAARKAFGKAVSPRLKPWGT
jgi:hypothetical protein